MSSDEQKEDLKNSLDAEHNQENQAADSTNITEEIKEE